jgi:general secretion pathway protein E
VQLLNYLGISNILPGQLILTPNIKVDSFHILVSGEVSIFKEIEETVMLAKVASIKVNESFGLVPLLLNEDNSLTAIATSVGSIVSIPKKVFTQLMGHAYFSIEVARNMAGLIQSANKHSGLENYDKKRLPDFKNISISIPLDIITRFQVLPLEQADKQLTLGLVNPDGHLLYSTIGPYLVNLKVNVFILTEEQFHNFLPLYKKQHGMTLDQKVSPIKGKQNTVQIVNDIISEGTKYRASDVHIEPTGEKLIVRYRVDGVLRESSFKISFPTPGIEIISRLKILSKMDITNKLTPQDGQICENIGGVNIFARVSAIPLKPGEKIVLRLIPEKVQVPPLISLTTDRELYQILQKVVKCRQGLFLITGPTGSRKTTTLYSLLHELNSIELNVVTVEDPVELEIPGINQIEINPKQNMTFEKALKAILRQDPDCIMIGEIRDKESARIALEAAMTGHLVLSTVHTPSSLDIIPRLRDLGVEKSLIASGLIGAMTQKLVRKICTHCFEDQIIESEDLHFIEQYLGPLMVPHHLKKGRGCPHCDQTGYLGRIPIFEGWISNKEVQDMIVKEAPLGQIKQHLEKSASFHELAFNAMKLATLGQTTLEEVRRVLGLV